MKIPILKNLSNPVHALIALAIGLTFFSINFALMAKLPGEVDNMCVIGGGLNAGNLIFTGILSVLLGIFAAGLLALFTKTKTKKSAAITALSGTGFVIGTFTVFCAVCTIPAISLFGLSTILGFFNYYNLAIKIISIIIVSLGLFFLNRQLANHCDRCVVAQEVKKSKI